MVKGLHAIWLFVLAGIVLTACSKPSPEEQAAQAALSYYQRIIEGYPDGLTDAKAASSEIPSDYRQALQKTFFQYAEDIKLRHGGLKAVTLSENKAYRDSIPTADKRYEQVVYAFLLLEFDDSTREEIAVPMVEQDGEWLMK